MSLWVQALIWALAVLFALAAIVTLLLALVHVRYHVAWRGTWGGFSSFQSGEARLEFGFPGFMHRWNWQSDRSNSSDSADPSVSSGSADTVDTTPTMHLPIAAVETQARATSTARPATNSFEKPFDYQSAAPHTGTTTTVPEQRAAYEAPRQSKKKQRDKNRDPHRFRKALFRLATDGPAWGMLVRYGFRIVRRFHALLGPRLEVAVGHPDPALLGRAAGYWYASAPVTQQLPLGKDLVMGFRFQDQAPSLHVRAEGGFSGLSLLWFGLGTLGTFPLIGLAGRAWHGWRHREMQGWRAWTYRRIQAL
jgi:hypothetical protein